MSGGRRTEAEATGRCRLTSQKAAPGTQAGSGPGWRLVADKQGSVRALQWSNFFLADVQTGLGPLLAAYLAAAGWAPQQVGYALTVGGVVTVLMQTPAGALVDRVHAKRAVLVCGALVLAAASLLLLLFTSHPAVYSAQVMIGAASPFLAPTLAAITMGLVGREGFDRQFGRNQAFNSGGNVTAALLILALAHVLGDKAIFYVAMALVVPTIVCVLAIRPQEIDYELARGGERSAPENKERVSAFGAVLQDRVLLCFLLCAFLFHFANAAMLPQLGEMLSQGKAKQAASFMSGCILVTQTVILLTANRIGNFAQQHGRKWLLVAGFAVLPLRAVLYTVVHGQAPLIAVQLLDGVANAIFGVVSVLVVADRTRGSGRFNLVQGALATAVGLGAALSTSYGGKLIQHFGYATSFLGLGGVAVLALLLLVFTVPETRLPDDSGADAGATATTQPA